MHWNVELSQLRSEILGQGLQAEADSEDRQGAGPRAPDRGGAQSKSLGLPGPGDRTTRSGSTSWKT